MSRPHNTIRTFALICVAVTSTFLMWMAHRYTNLLAAPDWCNRAIGAESVADGGTRARSDTAVQVCMELLLKQVSILGINSHVLIGIFALCLGALVVIVIAGGRLSFKAGAGGVEGSVSGKDDLIAGAQRVEGAAREERQAIEEEAAAEPEFEPEPEMPGQESKR